MIPRMLEMIRTLRICNATLIKYYKWNFNSDAPYWSFTKMLNKNVRDLPISQVNTVNVRRSLQSVSGSAGILKWAYLWGWGEQLKR